MPRPNPSLAEAVGHTVLPGIKHITLPEECSLEFITASDVPPELTTWLWEQKIPQGCLTIFTGNPDCGKTVSSIDLIARLTTGREMPDGTKNIHPPSKVVMLVAEDSLHQTIVPRLMAAQADLKLVQFLKRVNIKNNATRKERHFALSVDLAMLKSKLEAEPDIKLVVVDPIAGYIGDVSMNKEQELRDKVLEPMKQLCEDCQVTFIAIHHFNKRSDVAGMQRVSGAVAMSGMPRAVWAFGPDLDVPGEYLMMYVKCNLAKDKSGMRFAIVEQMVDVGGHPRIHWLGKSNKNVEDMIAHRDSDDLKKNKAIALIRELLADEQPHLVSEIYARGKDVGINDRTLQRVKKDMDDVIHSRDSANQHVWRLRTTASDVETQAF